MRDKCVGRNLNNRYSGAIGPYNFVKTSYESSFNDLSYGKILVFDLMYKAALTYHKMSTFMYKIGVSRYVFYGEIVS